MAIDFYGDDAVRARQQVGGESAPAGTDLHHQRFPLGTRGTGDTLQDGTANQEMLAEFLAPHR
jgi:hypothetical protein